MTVDSMVAVAILTCQPSSHPFNERQIGLQEAVKIGRSVARARPAPNNAIFDCKVLSRNHAMLWYENGKFFLQDTKSSNGTFVNHQRLSKGSEESPPRETYSGDIIQFGVDVMENSRRVTHGCIIATITLYHADGSEAKPDYNALQTTNGCPTLGAHSQELYQLSQYLQEALHREQMLENKLVNLQRLVENTQEASESGWQALIDEDRLLSRLEVLESQLHAYAKNQTEDNLRTELVALQEDKHNYETTAKESLRRILEEKLEAVRKLSDLEQSLGNAEDECGHLKQMFDMSKRELETLTIAHQETTQEVVESKEKLKEALENYEKELESVKEEKMEAEAKLTTDSGENEAENDEADDSATEEKVLEPMQVSSEEESQGAQGQTIDDQDLEASESNQDADETSRDGLEMNSTDNDLNGQLTKAQKEIESYKNQISDAQRRLDESHLKVQQLQRELKNSDTEARKHLSRLGAIEQIEAKGSASKNELSSKLHLQIEEIEKQLSNYDQESTNVTILASSDDTNSNPVNDVTDTNTTTNHVVESLLTVTRQSHIDELQRIKQLLCDARTAQQSNEAQITKYKIVLEETQTQTNNQVETTRQVEAKLNQAVKAASDKDECITQLRDQVKKKDVNVQDVEIEMKQIQGQLVEAQKALKHSRNEAQQLRVKAEELSGELMIKKEEENNEVTDLKDDSTRSSEFSTLRQECDHLRQRILKIESDMRNSKQENLQLSADYNRLQESYHQLENLKQKLELQQPIDGSTSSGSVSGNMTDAQKEAEVQQSLSDSDDNVKELTKRVTSSTDEISHLQTELNEMSGEYALLAEKTRTLSMCAMIPIIILIFALVLAFHPTLSAITATTTAPE